MPEAPTPTIDALAHAVTRTADQLRRLPESTLRRPAKGVPGATVADVAHSLGQWLADAAATVQPGGRPAPGHPVPRLSDLAVGDQVAVTGHELLDALTEPSVGADAAGWLVDAMDRLAALRRTW